MQKLSKLQEYILKKTLGCKPQHLKNKCRGEKGGIDKNIFFNFYEKVKSPQLRGKCGDKNKPKDIENIIIKSLNRLIERDLIMAFCKKTKHKIFIKKVLLTSEGKKIAKQLWGTQKKLPMKYKKTKKHLSSVALAKEEQINKARKQ